MIIERLIIRNFRQFKSLDLNLVTETGEPRSLCFIGPNGAGKSTIIEHLFSVTFPFPSNIDPGSSNAQGFILTQILLSSGLRYLRVERDLGQYLPLRRKQGDFRFRYFKTELLEADEWLEQSISEQLDFKTFCTQFKDFEISVRSSNHELYQAITNEPVDCSIFVSPSAAFDAKSFENVDLNLGVSLFDQVDTHHIVDTEQSADFWKHLTYQVKLRENQFQEFLNKAEDTDKSYKELKNQFDSEHPKILDTLAEYWDRILGHAGLRFAAERAKIPVQLNDKLDAYIVRNVDDIKLPYGVLSAGIRAFIFRIGHILSLLFKKDYNNIFLFIDEPENSLHPDFLYDLIGIYRDLVGEQTPMMVATHSPIIAAQFAPQDRVRLEFDDEGFVRGFEGEAPIGDDPNDLLRKDFSVRSVYPEAGRKKWEEYRNLRSRIDKETDEEKKERLVEKYMSIGREYGFTPNGSI